MSDPVPAGSDVSAGTYKCTNWGFELDIGSTQHLPPVPRGQQRRMGNPVRRRRRFRSLLDRPAVTASRLAATRPFGPEPMTTASGITRPASEAAVAGAAHEGAAVAVPGAEGDRHGAARGDGRDREVEAPSRLCSLRRPRRRQHDGPANATKTAPATGRETRSTGSYCERVSVAMVSGGSGPVAARPCTAGPVRRRSLRGRPPSARALRRPAPQAHRCAAGERAPRTRRSR